MERERPTTSATPTMSPAPLMKASTASASDRCATSAITMAITKNQVLASLKYQSPMEEPVSQPVQLWESSTVWVVLALVPWSGRDLAVVARHVVVAVPVAFDHLPESCVVSSCEEAPASNTLTPKSFEGTKPQIVTTNA